ncbi:MAG: Gfo/Idh/MocA family oxidoreductase [Victivallaceae bacterium]
MIKTAIIGVSGFGNIHYNDLIRYQEHGKLEITAATIINQDEEAEKCARLKAVGCEIFSDYKAMLEKFRDTIDICFIPTGISLHAPMAIAALEAGANVYVEKPITATLRDLAAIKEAESKSGKFVAVGYQNIYQPSTAKIKNAILAGDIGEVKTIKFCGITVRDKAYYSRNNWAGRIKIGENWILDSPFNNAMAHQLNLLCFFAGKTFENPARLKTVQAQLFRANPDIENADNAAMEIITEDNKKLLYYATHTAECNEEVQIIITGTQGVIKWTFDKTTYKIDGREYIHENNDNRDHVMDALLAKAKGEKSFICDLAIAGSQTLVVNAAHASSEINAAPPEYVITQPYKDSTSERLKDISEIMSRAFQEERLFTRADYPWMKTGRIVDIAHDDIEKLIRENLKLPE